MATAQEMLNMDMGEILKMSDKKDWDLATLEVWSTFKIAQYLSEIAAQGRRTE